jgi:hypothetical protein
VDGWNGTEIFTALFKPDWFPTKGRLLPRPVQMVPHRHQGKGFDTVGLLPPVSVADMPPPPDAVAAAEPAEATEQSASA